MDDQSGNAASLPDPTEMSKSMASIAERSQKLVAEFVNRQMASGSLPDTDPMNVSEAFMELSRQMMANPAKMMESSMNLWSDYLSLWQTTTQRMMGADVGPMVTPAKDDHRFRDDAWADNQVFDFVKQSYLLTSRWMQSSVSAVDGMDKKTAEKVDFYTRQFTDALSPSNFVMTNPEVLRATMESGGENLVKGLENLIADMENSDGQLRIKMTDPDAFQVGENVATTPGKVVFRNDLMELLQFNPTTEETVKTPLLIIPPWINKYYILDLREKNSFIKWATDQGHSVFVISWVNPDAELAAKSFDDYMLEGPVAALDAIEKATGEKKTNVIGYCIGGTLLASALAYLTVKKQDKRVNSATFFTTMVDFTEAGDLGIFIDEAQLSSLEEKMEERGYLEGSEMATTFNMLRSNDLIWSFVINNYLLGKDPFPFDLLYWNSDSTRMPAAMHSFYLRKMYLENKLIEPGGLELAGVKIDLSTIKVPTYIVATREDHIAPWKSAYAPTQIYSGPTRFVLAGSGHIAGVVNPPAKPKYGHWTNDDLSGSADEWLNGAEEHVGSWWPNWDSWAKERAGNAMIPARKPGDGKLKPLCDAPGEYVMMKAEG
ncbi:MAG: class I poly(R)-hydroxyalkanoic acid synthase [Rhodospirillaceae bacterium]|nr:class I poly(R)-hydroxyalkanoic acid synthase [Rhodospirillaceae bacterium]